MSNHRQPIKADASNWRGNLRQSCLQRAQQRRQQWIDARRARGREQAQALVNTEVRQLIEQEVHAAFCSIQPEQAPPPLDPGTVEALMQELYLELVEAELDALEQQEAAMEAALMQGAAEHAAMQQQLCEAGGCGVLCPVCGRAYLLQLHGCITCPADRFKLDVRREGTTLHHVRANLERLHQEHHSSGCRGNLVFSIEDWLGPKCMLATCNQCNLLNVVV